MNPLKQNSSKKLIPDTKIVYFSVTRGSCKTLYSIIIQWYRAILACFSDTNVESWFQTIATPNLTPTPFEKCWYYHLFVVAKNI